MSKKIIQKDVEKFFKENNCELLDKYVGIKIKVKYLAQCGHKSYISFGCFKRGQGRLCKECSNKSKGVKKTLSQNEVEKYFLENNCKLLSKYISAKVVVKYVAQCGHINNIVVDYFKRGNGRLCKRCAMKDIGNKNRLSYLDVEKCFRIRGCTLLKQKYKDTKTPLKYIATCGHFNITTLDAFKAGKGLLCKSCSKKEAIKNKRLSYDYVSKYFLHEKCKLISTEYKGNDKKLKYIATCGHENISTFSSFQQGTGRLCRKCSVKKGENNPSWNPNLTNEERINKRKVPENNLWRKEVFKRDSYTCQITGKKGNGDLVAHHLKPYHKYKDLRFEVSNGITLNEEFHKFAHDIFGYKAEIDLNKLKEAKLIWKNNTTLL